MVVPYLLNKIHELAKCVMISVSLVQFFEIGHACILNGKLPGLKPRVLITVTKNWIENTLKVSIKNCMEVLLLKVPFPAGFQTGKETYDPWEIKDTI